MIPPKSWSSQRNDGNQRQWLIFAALAFGALDCIPAIRLPLWLDEILQLLLTRTAISLQSFLKAIADNAGGVPVGYFTQAVFLHIIGYSAFSARLPSLLFSVFSSIGVGVLGRQAGLKRPILALCLFCMLPLQVRYAWEARPYEQALCLSIWSTVLFRRLLKQPDLSTSCVYLGVGILAVYTQPFSIFAMAAQQLWLAIEWVQSRSSQSRRALILSASATCLVGLSFLPWLEFAKSRWHAAIEAAPTGSGIDLKTPLLIAREISGAGYLGAALLGVICMFALRKRAKGVEGWLFWISLIFVPILLSLGADSYFRYFFAIRQIVFILPALAILCCLGWESILATNRTVTYILTSMLLVSCLYANIHSLYRAREDWEAAATTIEAVLKRSSSACYLPLPNNAGTLFEFFVPSIRLSKCPDLGVASRYGYDRVVLAMSPYGSHDLGKTSRLLLDHGFKRELEFSGSKPIVEVWQRF